MTKTVLLVQPGLGKTTLAEQRPKEFLDFDFGMIRNSVLGSIWEDRSMAHNVKLIYPALYELVAIGFQFYPNIMINDPNFVKYIHSRSPHWRIAVVTHSTAQAWTERQLDRDGVWAFTKELKVHASEWLSGWIETGRELGFLWGIDENQYLSDVVDDILDEL